MSGYHISVDQNQNTIMMELSAFGIQSRSVAGARGAGLDIICASNAKPTINLLVEIKAPGQRNELRDSEKWMRDNWPGPWIVAETTEEILEWFANH